MLHFLAADPEMDPPSVLRPIAGAHRGPAELVDLERVLDPAFGSVWLRPRSRWPVCWGATWLSPRREAPRPRQMWRRSSQSMSIRRVGPRSTARSRDYACHAGYLQRVTGDDGGALSRMAEPAYSIDAAGGIFMRCECRDARHGSRRPSLDASGSPFRLARGWERGFPPAVPKGIGPYARADRTARRPSLTIFSPLPTRFRRSWMTSAPAGSSGSFAFSMIAKEEVREDHERVPGEASALTPVAAGLRFPEIGLSAPASRGKINLSCPICWRGSPGCSGSRQPLEPCLRDRRGFPARGRLPGSDLSERTPARCRRNAGAGAFRGSRVSMRCLARPGTGATHRPAGHRSGQGRCRCP